MAMLKTFTHTSIPIHPCTLLKQRAKPSTHQTGRLRLVVLFLSNVVVGNGQEAWQMLLRRAPRRRPALLDIVLHFPLLVLFLSSVRVTDGQVTSHLLLRTAPRRRPSRLGQYSQKTFESSDTNTAHSNNPRNYPFLPGFSNSPG